MMLKEEKEDDKNADDEGDGPGDKTPAAKEDKEEEQDKVLELKDQDTGNVIHKKRRRKNVESRDVQT